MLFSIGVDIDVVFFFIGGYFFFKVLGFVWAVVRTCGFYLVLRFVVVFGNV